MTDADPYLTLGVPRTAGRDEIARAFRRLAKRHHPDAGAQPSAEMARINEAWHTLSDPTRRARWDQRHGSAFAPPHWTAAPATPYPEPAARPIVQPAPPTRFDSGRAAAAIVAVVVVGIGAFMIFLSTVVSPAASFETLGTSVLFAQHPVDWVAVVGDGDDPPEHRLVAHLATWNADPARLCTTYGETCGIETANIPPGEASILITSHAGGTPPVTDPGNELTIGGAPAAYELTRVEPGLALAWWQLSPPEFPERWIEVRALIRETSPPQSGSDVLTQIEAMLATLEFP